MNTWLLLTYKIPPEPSAKRVYIWRKLKRIGALLHQESSWILPSSPRNQEQFRWLCVEILEMGGDASLWEATLIIGTTDEKLIQRFIDQVELPYSELIVMLDKEEPELESISRQYQQILSKDYFKSDTGKHLRELLLAKRGDEP